MTEQLKWIILACLTLTFFSCEPLPRSKKVGAEQQTSRQILTHLVSFRITSGENAELISENPVKAEAGIATFLLRTKDFKAPISIEATTDGLAPGTITIK